MRPFRVFLFAIFISGVLGLITSCAVLMASEPCDNLVQILSTGRGWSDTLEIGIFVSLQMAIPPAFVGGLLAARMAKNETSPATRSSWVFKGIWVGALLGALWPISTTVGGHFHTVGSNTQNVLYLFAVLVPGVITGAAIGAIVGCYASRQAGSMVRSAVS